MDVLSSENGGVRMVVNNEWNYPQLGNSNFMKPPVKVGEGYTNMVRVRFGATSRPLNNLLTMNLPLKI